MLFHWCMQTTHADLSRHHIEYGRVPYPCTRPYTVGRLHGESMVVPRKGKDPRFGLQRGRLALAAGRLNFFGIQINIRREIMNLNETKGSNICLTLYIY